MKRSLAVAIALGLLFDRQRRVERRIKAQQRARDEELRRWGLEVNAGIRDWIDQAVSALDRVVNEVNEALRAVGRQG